MPVMALASYPKSGSTWMRTLLSNLASEDGEAVSINALNGGVRLDSRQGFDDWLGLSSAFMTNAETLRHRPSYHLWLAAQADPGTVNKTHHAFQRLPDGAPLFSASSFSGALCVVRNPLDVAVSFAHHLQISLDRTIGHMGDPDAHLERWPRGLKPVLPTWMSDWSSHVSSWLDQDELPAKVVRYEDLHADPEAVLGAVAAFAGLPAAPGQVARAVEHSSFRRLREQEERQGFREKQPTAPSFFRKGQVGDWRGVLSRGQVGRLVDRHGAAMARLGYLGEAERFLASGME